MGAPYGVVNTGFNSKLLAEILAELEVDEQAVFGQGVIVNESSPLGQINGLFADAVSELWELAHGVYGSFDVDQALGNRLDSLAKLRRLKRVEGQSDAEFRTIITNANFGKIKNRFTRSALTDVDGVTWASIAENSSNESLYNGLPGKSFAIAVQGGEDEDIAQKIYDTMIPGTTLYGNTLSSIVVDGFCRTISFVRPILVNFDLEINLVQLLDGCECSPASVSTISQAVVDKLSGPCGIRNGQSISPNLITQAVSDQSGIVVDHVKIGRTGYDLTSEPWQTTIFELAVFDTSRITIKYV